MTRPCILALALAAVSALPADAPAGPALAPARGALQSAVNRGDAGAILAARAQFESAAVADPKSAAPRYWVALADWRTLPLVGEKDKEQAKRIARDGLKRIDEALQLDPKAGAAYALKAALQGMSIGLEPSSMMTLGPDSEVNFQRARALAPDDPRVWLLDGIGALNKPASFGGGAAAALARFTKAQELFAAAPADSAGEFGWGRDDAFLWAGRAEMGRGNFAASVTLFRQALAANPSNGWVSRGLLPGAEQALREQGAK